MNTFSTRKSLKKAIVLIGMALLVVFSSMSAFAATTKQDILDELHAGVEIGGKTVAIPEKYTKVAADFFNANTLTDEQMDYAMAQLKEAKEMVTATGKEHLREMTLAQQEALINKATEAAKTVGATFTYDGKNVQVVDANGKTFSVSMRSDEIKFTGYENTSYLLVISAAVLAVLGLAAVVAKKNGLFAGR